MSNVRIPRVLFLDDKEDVVRDAVRVAFSDQKVETRLLHPESVEQGDLDWADLVISDYFLEVWTERDEQISVSRKPVDGLAVIASLRSNRLPTFDQRRSGALPERPLAFALWSAHLPQVAFDLPDFVLPHVFSRENNLEWAFKRNDLLAVRGLAQVCSLAGAVVELASMTPVAGREVEDLMQMLALQSGAVWSDQARESVLSCRPPIHELGPRTRGLSIVRWLMHRILPYPCFLMNETELRARLRVDELGSEASELAIELAEFRYTGLLADFSEPLWWRVAVESWLWDLGGTSQTSASGIAAVSVAKGAQRKNEWINPVPVINASLERTSFLCEIGDVVRVRPDDWPVFAEDAYAALEDVKADPALQSIVHPGDRGRLDSRLS